MNAADNIEPTCRTLSYVKCDYWLVIWGSEIKYGWFVWEIGETWPSVVIMTS